MRRFLRHPLIDPSNLVKQIAGDQIGVALLVSTILSREIIAIHKILSLVR